MNCGLYLITVVFLVWSELLLLWINALTLPAELTYLNTVVCVYLPHAVVALLIFPLWVFGNFRGKTQHFFIIDKYFLFLESCLDLHSHLYLCSLFMTELVKLLPLVRALWEVNELLFLLNQKPHLTNSSLFRILLALTLQICFHSGKSGISLLFFWGF